MLQSGCQVHQHPGDGERRRTEAPSDSGQRHWHQGGWCTCERPWIPSVITRHFKTKQKVPLGKVAQSAPIRLDLCAHHWLVLLGKNCGLPHLPVLQLSLTKLSIFVSEAERRYGNRLWKVYHQQTPDFWGSLSYCNLWIQRRGEQSSGAASAFRLLKVDVYFVAHHHICLCFFVCRPLPV